MKFRATIEGAGKTAAGIHVPNEVVAALGPSRKPAVKVTLKGYTYRSSVATVGGRFMIGVSAQVREAAGVAAGDDLDVDLELDTEPRVVTVPSDLAAALHRDAAARRTFDALSYSNKRRLVEPIAAAKAPETRERRIARTVAMLHEGRS
ncbi:MAG: YdeI/OmpD-associated family protein [Chloroflexota bacterium]|nr:YdeI/OmpD-associated family protein [Chloroflexota bacterium]